VNIADWMDGGDPHDPARSAEQLDWLRSWCGTESRRVLDLGCGDGRTVVELASMGHAVVGMDRNAAALECCRTRLGAAEAVLVHGNFQDPWPDLGGPFDVVLCLGNTFMLLHDPAAATEMLVRCAAELAPDGVIVLDDIPGEFLPEVESGNWADGISDDGSLQMIWSQDEAVFTIRSGEAVDETVWSFRDDDVLLRLWTDSTLAQVAEGAGLSGPHRVESGPGTGAVLVMRSVQAV
jgi:SAM-dependent methyltransferase